MFSPDVSGLHIGALTGESGKSFLNALTWE
jgi:hypothetical protein